MAKRSLAEKYYKTKRQKELFVPLDQRIMMCDDAEDLVLLASMMLRVGRDIILDTMGTERAVEYIQSLEYGNPVQEKPKKTSQNKES